MDEKSNFNPQNINNIGKIVQKGKITQEIKPKVAGQTVGEKTTRSEQLSKAPVSKKSSWWYNVFKNFRSCSGE